MMMSAAYQGIRTILVETNQRMGWQIPTKIVDYEARLFAERIDKNPWQPEPSYAEQYLMLRSTEAAQQLGDTCFFTRAVFPELGSRHGITSSYYVQLGQGCYERVLQSRDNDTIAVLNRHFEFLAETAYTAIRHYGDFRSMWD